MAGEGRDGMEELIPENSTLARRIRAAASKGTLSHAAILSGSGDRMAAARYFAAALECAAPAFTISAIFTGTTVRSSIIFFSLSHART